MKLMFLLVFVHLVAGVRFSGDFVRELSVGLNSTREEVQTCVNRTGVTVEDMMHFDQIVEDGLKSTDYTERAFKIGCLVACIAQQKEMMTGAKMHIDKIKEIFNSEFEHESEKLVLFMQILDTCDNRVKSMTNECKMSLVFLFCFLNELRRHQENNNLH